MMGRVSYNLVKDDEDDDEDEEVEFDQQDLRNRHKRKNGRGKNNLEEVKETARVEKIGRFRSLCVFVFVHIVVFTVGMCSAVIGPNLPDINKQVNQFIDSVSWIFFGRGAGFVIGASVAGILHQSGLSGSTGSEVGWFAVSMGALAMGLAAMPLCEHYWEMMGAVFLQGIAIGHIYTAYEAVWRRCCRFSDLCGGGAGTSGATVRKRRLCSRGGLRLTFGLGALCAVLLVLSSITDTENLKEVKPDVTSQRNRVVPERHRRDEGVGNFEQSSGGDPKNDLPDFGDDSPELMDSSSVPTLGVMDNAGSSSTSSSDSSSSSSTSSSVSGSTSSSSTTISSMNNDSISISSILSTPGVSVSSTTTPLSVSVTPVSEVSSQPSSPQSLINISSPLSTEPSLATSASSSPKPMKPSAAEGTDHGAADGKKNRADIIKNLDANVNPGLNPDDKGDAVTIDSAAMETTVSPSNSTLNMTDISNSTEIDNNTINNSGNISNSDSIVNTGNATSDIGGKVDVANNVLSAIESTSPTVIPFYSQSPSSSVAGGLPDPVTPPLSSSSGSAVIPPSASPSSSFSQISDSGFNGSIVDEQNVNPDAANDTEALIKDLDELMKTVGQEDINKEGGSSSATTLQISSTPGLIDIKFSSSVGFSQASSVWSDVDLSTSTSTVATTSTSTVTTASTSTVTTASTSTSVQPIPTSHSSTSSFNPVTTKLTPSTRRNTVSNSNGQIKEDREHSDKARKNYLWEGMNTVYLLPAAIAALASFFGLVISRCSCFKTSCCSRRVYVTGAMLNGDVHGDDESLTAPLRSACLSFFTSVLTMLLSSARLALDALLGGLLVAFVLNRFSWPWMDAVYACILVWGLNCSGQLLASLFFMMTRCRGFTVTVAACSLVVGGIILEAVIISADINPPQQHSTISNSFYAGCAVLGFGSALIPTFSELLPWNEPLPWQQKFGGRATACMWRLMSGVLVGCGELMGPALGGLISAGYRQNWFVHYVFVLAAACSLLAILSHCCLVSSSVKHSNSSNRRIPDPNVMETSLVDSDLNGFSRTRARDIDDDDVNLLDDPVTTGLNRKSTHQEPNTRHKQKNGRPVRDYAVGQNSLLNDGSDYSD